MRTVGPALLVCLSALAASVIVAVVPAPADAGAWTREPGNLQVITTVGRRGEPFRAGEDDSGVQTDTMQFYAEYGLIEGLTVGAKF